MHYEDSHRVNPGNKTALSEEQHAIRQGLVSDYPVLTQINVAGHQRIMQAEFYRGIPTFRAPLELSPGIYEKQVCFVGFVYYP